MVDQDDLVGSLVIVIDLLRASTTICQALNAGALGIVPFLEVQEVLGHSRENHPSGQGSFYLLGGERKGQRIPQFDLGNSPKEYTTLAVEGRKVLFTTTNGTRALHHARQAQEVFIGAAVNAQALASVVSSREGQVDMLCAGTDGQITDEDLLAAGAIASRIRAVAPRSEWKLNASAKRSLHHWENLTSAAQSLGRSESEQLAHQLIETQGGKNLIRIGKGSDLICCSKLDSIPCVPIWDRESGEIRLS